LIFLIQDDTIQIKMQLIIIANIMRARAKLNKKCRVVLT